MTLRERILAVYDGRTPDVVPYMLDLSHWFYQQRRLPWDLSVTHEEVETDLLDCHRRLGAGFYLVNLSSFYTCDYRPEIQAETVKRTVDGAPAITWRFRTPLGDIERTRVWHEETYAWAIRSWSMKSEKDLAVLRYAMEGRKFSPRWENYEAWRRAVGDQGVVYMPVGYSGIGHLLHYWMGVEGLTYAAADWPEAVRAVVDTINAGNLELVDLLCSSPAEIIIMADHFSSDVQPPHFFAKWAKPFYVEAVRRLHAAGKRVAAHMDGRLRGMLAEMSACGVDCADAVTPKPMGDLLPSEIRHEAGDRFILSGGVSPDLWRPESPDEAFRQAVLRWLELRARSSRLIANAGDQVPPGAPEYRIELMRDLVERHGKFPAG
jgi:hypothetical protein